MADKGPASSETRIGTPWHAELVKQQEPSIGSPWITELATVAAKKKADTPSSKEDLKAAEKIDKSLDVLSGFSPSGSSEFTVPIERARHQSAWMLDPKERAGIKSDLQAYLKTTNKPLYDDLKALDAIEQRLSSGGKKNAAELAQVRAIQDRFYNPYGGLTELGAKAGLTVFFPKEGSKDFLSGPYIQLPMESGVQYKVGDAFKLPLKGLSNPAQAMEAVAQLPSLVKESADLRAKYGANHVIVETNAAGALVTKASIDYNNKAIEVSFESSEKLGSNLESLRKSILSDITKRYNVDIAQEGAAVLFHDSIASEKALAPTIPQALALSDALRISHGNFPNGDKALKVYWTNIGPDGLFAISGGRPSIYLSPKTSTGIRAGWDISEATYVAVHEFGHYATSTFNDQPRRTAFIAQAFGWERAGSEEKLVGKDGTRYCFTGYADNPQNPLAPTLELDKWVSGCPTVMDRLVDKVTKGQGFPEIGRQDLGRNLPKTPFTNYYWNIEETAVEALTAFQSGATSRARLAQLNPEAYRRVQKLDEDILARKSGAGQKLIRAIDGTIVPDTPELRETINQWERKNLKR